MSERPSSSYERSPVIPAAVLWLALTASAIVADMQSVFAQGGSKDAKSALVKPRELPPPLAPAKLTLLILELSDEEFATREDALKELIKHAHEVPTMQALTKVINEAKAAIAHNGAGKQPYKQYDVERYKRSLEVVATQRFWNEQHIPSISYLPDDVTLPPDLQKELEKLDGFDKRHHFLKLADKDGTEWPDGPQYPRFREAAKVFTNKYRAAAEKDARASKDYHSTIQMWERRLTAILARWEREEELEKSRALEP